MPKKFPLVGLLVLAIALAACTAANTPTSNPAQPTQKTSPPPQTKMRIQVSTPQKVDTARPPFNTEPPTPAPTTPIRVMPSPGTFPKTKRTPLPFPQPEDAQMATGVVHLKDVQAEAADGGKVLLTLSGQLPTPCSQLRVAVKREKWEIKVKVYSVYEPNTECADVLKPFSVRVKIGPFPDGEYILWVNGQKIGKVQVKHNAN